MRKPAKPATENDLREELDVMLVQLPERVREAVVLRYLEGRGQEDAARIAGCDKGTLSRRCTQGLNRLQALLSQRGLSVVPAVLTGFLARQAADSASSATSNALQALGAGAAVASTQASVLAQGTLKAMFWAKAKWCAALVAATTTVAGAGVAIALAIHTFPPASAGSPVSTAEVLLRFDFEDGKLPALCTVGKLVQGPQRPGNRFCLEGGPFAGAANKGKIFLEKEGGLLTFTDDLALVFDLWVDARVSTVDLHLWNQTQQASQGVEPLRVERERWIERVVVRFADFKHGPAMIGPKPRDVFSSVAIQSGQQNGTICIDNLEIVRSPQP